MKILKYIYGLMALLAVSACSDEVYELERQPEVNDDGTITLDVSMAVPEMVQTASRAMGDTPDYTNLQLYIVAFNRKSADDPTANVYINNYTATDQTLGADGMLHFKVTLLQSVEPRVLHLIAVPKDVVLDLGKYGSEEKISRLSTSAGNEAYWQRVDFPNGYGSLNDQDEFVLNPETKEKLTAVPMIRNFAQIAVEKAANDNTANFSLEGFMVVNTPTAGTVAPWGNMNFPVYLDASNKQLEYDRVNYGGILSSEADFENDNVSDVAGSDKYSLAPKFLYERPKSSLDPTVVIIKGNYNNEGTSYYKVDLGKSDSNGIFQIYNILRNFRYVISVTGVTTSGYSTPESALSGVTYNNLSFDVRTEKMLNISDGKAMLWVTGTTLVVTKEENRDIYFGYKFKTDINDKTVAQNNDKINWTSLARTNPDLNNTVESVEEFPGIPEGFDATQYADYKFFKIRTKDLNGPAADGFFNVVDPITGLGRKISVVVSPPFEITRNRIFAGNYNMPDQFPYNRLQWENVVESGLGKPMTIFFTLDDNLPEAIFPLTFEIEANPQDIENNPIGTLVVAAGLSSFPNLENVRRIKYQKIVTWHDYNTELSETDKTGLLVPDKLYDNTGEKKIRRVRCRLRTINAAAKEQFTKIRITNPYFKLGKWTKVNWQGQVIETIEASDVIEMEFKRDPKNNPVGVPDFKNWTDVLVP